MCKRIIFHQSSAVDSQLRIFHNTISLEEVFAEVYIYYGRMSL